MSKDSSDESNRRPISQVNDPRWNDEEKRILSAHIGPLACAFMEAIEAHAMHEPEHIEIVSATLMHFVRVGSVYHEALMKLLEGGERFSHLKLGLSRMELTPFEKRALRGKPGLA